MRYFWKQNNNINVRCKFTNEESMSKKENETDIS